MIAREIRELAWLTRTVGIGAVALCIAAKALRVAHWCNRQGKPRRVVRWEGWPI